MSPKKIIMNYWRSWQGHSDWENTRRYMADDLRFDTGTLVYEDTDSVTGERFRIAEVLTVEGKKLSSCLTTIARLPAGTGDGDD